MNSIRNGIDWFFAVQLLLLIALTCAILETEPVNVTTKATPKPPKTKPCIVMDRGE